MARITQQVVLFLWFDRGCEEAINFYVSVFSSSPGNRENSKINN